MSLAFPGHESLGSTSALRARWWHTHLDVHRCMCVQPAAGKRPPRRNKGVRKMHCAHAICRRGKIGVACVAYAYVAAMLLRGMVEGIPTQHYVRDVCVRA
jgi:hypothetical protein